MEWFDYSDLQIVWKEDYADVVIDTSYHGEPRQFYIVKAYWYRVGDVYMRFKFSPFSEPWYLLDQDVLLTLYDNRYSWKELTSHMDLSKDYPNVYRSWLESRQLALLIPFSEKAYLDYRKWYEQNVEKIKEHLNCVGFSIFRMMKGLYEQVKMLQSLKESIQNMLEAGGFSRKEIEALFKRIESVALENPKSPASIQQKTRAEEKEVLANENAENDLLRAWWKELSQKNIP